VTAVPDRPAAAPIIRSGADIPAGSLRPIAAQIGRDDEAVPVYAAPDQDVCGVDI